MVILTFNHHEAYLRLLAGIPATFHVITQYRGLDLSWNPAAGPPPPNVKLLDFDDSEVTDRLKNNEYDWIICHTIRNLTWLWRYPKVPLVFIGHIPLFSYTKSAMLKSLAKRQILRLSALRRPLRFVAGSKLKKDTWGAGGTIIHAAPNIEGLGQVHHEELKVVTVGNEIHRRGDELGYSLLRELSLEVPITVLGDNDPSRLKGAHRPKNREEYCQEFNNGNIYLYCIRQPYGDGFNMAMLEAMAMGMAVVTTANPSSPVVHGESGLVGSTADELKEHLVALRNNPEQVKSLGDKAKEVVKKHFSYEVFLERWAQVLEA